MNNPSRGILIGSKLREKKYCTPSNLVHQPNQCHVVTQRGQSLEIWSILSHFWHHNCCKIPLRLGILLTMLTVVLFRNTSWTHPTISIYKPKLVLTHTTNFKKFPCQFGACTNLGLWWGVWNGKLSFPYYKISFSVLIISFSVLILLSPHFWKDVSLHIYTVSVWVITIESIQKNNMCVCKHWAVYFKHFKL